MAKPTPMEPAWLPSEDCDNEAIAELIPMTAPFMSTSAPPELPGLMAASVCTALITVSCDCPAASASPEVRTGRFRAETMPDVTVAERPSGEPIATTGWPTARSAELPSVAGVRPETPSALITARSSVAVVPTKLAVAVVPSLNRTSRSVAPATTWLLVRMRPSAVRITPEPSPLLWLELASTDTVDGSTLAATSCTEPAGAGVRCSDTGAPVFSWLSELSEALDVLVFSFPPSNPPPNPTINARATEVTTIAELRRPLAGAGGGGLTVAVLP